MDKKLILAVAGSGKTYYIVQQLNETDRFLLITFTVSGTENLRSEIMERFGYMPCNLKVQNYFSFLYTFCYKPLFADEIRDKGIYWKYPGNSFNQSYLTQTGYLYYNRIAKFLIEKSIEQVRNRIAKYYDYLLIDEIQDFAGHDFDFLTELVKAPVKTTMVGDFYQHTFDTSRDKNKNASLHKCFQSFLDRFRKLEIEYDQNTLVKSRRCSKSVCDFIRTNLEIEIHACDDRRTECRLLTDATEVRSVIEDNSIIKLFYQQSYNFYCRSDNWGASKGLTYKDVCVVVNDEILGLLKGNGPFIFKSATTKNKFYVACSRASGNLYFVSQKALAPYKKAVLT